MAVDFLEEARRRVASGQTQNQLSSSAGQGEPDFIAQARQRVATGQTQNQMGAPKITKPSQQKTNAAIQATLADIGSGNNSNSSLVAKATGNYYDNTARKVDRVNNRAGVVRNELTSRLAEETASGQPILDPVRDKLKGLEQQQAALEAQREKEKAEAWEQKQKAAIDATGNATLMQDLQRLAELENQVKAYQGIVGMDGNIPEVNQATSEYLALQQKLKDQYGKDLDNWKAYASRVGNREFAEQLKAETAADAKDNWFGMTLARAPINAVSGIGFVDANLQKAQRLLTGSDAPIDYNTPAMQLSQMSNAITEGATERIEEDTAGKWGSDTALGNVYSGLYNLGVSMGDSVIGMATGTSLLMAGAAATNAMVEAKERGATDNQALLFGLAAGAMEGVMEKASIDSLFNMADPKTTKQLVLSVLKQGGVEASEEVLTTIANTVADAIIMGNKNQLTTAINDYIEQGYSPEEAEKKAMKDWGNGLVMDAIGGLISGGTFEAVKGGTGYISNRTGTNQAQNQLDTAIQETLGQNKTAPVVETEANAMLSENDLQDYLSVGERQHVRDTKLKQLNDGGSPILTSVGAVRDFIKSAITRSIPNTIKAYGKVGKNMSADVAAASGGKINIDGYYLELDSNRLAHLSEHIQDDGDPRNIPLTEEQVLNLPEYINNYDDILGTVTKKDGSKRIILGKKINGHAVIVELVSKGRSSIQPVTAWQNETSHYQQKYNKNESTNYIPTASEAEDNGYKRTLNDSIPTNTENVNGSVGDMGAKTSDFKHEVKKSQSHSIENREDFFKVPEDQRTEFQHTEVTEKESLHNARLRLEQDYEGEKAQLMQETTWNGEQVDESRMISDDLLSEAQRTGTEEAWQEYRDWRKVMKQHDTEIARGLQALAKYARKTGSKIVELASDALETAKPGTDNVDVLNTVADYAEQYDAAVGKKDIDSLVQIIKNTSVTRRTGTFRKNNLSKEISWALNRVAEFAKADLAKAKDTNVQQTKPQPVQNYTLKAGDRVTVSDRDNVGTITEVKADGTYTVHFKAKSGTEATKTFPADMVTKLGQNKPAVSIPGNNYDVGPFYDFLENFAAAGIEAIATDKQKVSAGKVVMTIRRNAMLSKFATIMRNLVGNGAFDMVDTFSRNISVPLDMMLSKITGTRSVAFDRGGLSKEGRKGLMDGLAKSLLEVGLDVNAEGAASKYERSSNRTFKMSGGVVSKMLSGWEKHMGYALNVTDEAAKGSVNARVQRGLDKLYEKGKITDDSLRDGGAQEALYRTFQDDSALARMSTKMRGALNEAHVGDIGLGDTLMPFAQVPANLADRAIDYSPTGLVKGAYGLVDTLIKAKKGTLTAAEQAKAVQTLGRNITGSGLIILAAAAAAKGLIRVVNPGGEDENKDKAAYEKMQGQNGTQFNLSGLLRWMDGGSADWQNDDVLMSIAFLEPFNAHLTIGALLAEDLEAEGQLTGKTVAMDTFTGALTAIGDLPMFSAFGDAYEAYQYSDKEREGERWLDAGNTLLANEVSSIIPNAWKGIAQGLDPYQRDLYSKEGAWAQTGDQFRAVFDRDGLPIKQDSYGRDMTNEGGVLNFLNTNILPGQITKYRESDLDKAIQQTYERTGKTSVFPSRKPPEEITVDGNTVELHKEQQRRYQQIYGQAEQDTRTALYSNDLYGRLNGENELKAQAYAEDYAKQTAKAGLLIGYEPETWVKELKGKSPQEVADAIMLKTFESMANNKKVYTNKYDGISGLLDAHTIDDTVALAVMSDSAVDGYMDYCKKAGVSVSEYADVYAYMSKSDSKEDTLKYIEGLSVSKSKKVALAQGIYGANPTFIPIDSDVPKNWLLEMGATAEIVDQFSDSQKELYNTYIRNTGVDMGDYLNIWSFKQSAKSDKDANGKTTYSAQNKVIDEIDRLDVSNEVKRNLFLSMDYSEKNIPHWWK